MLFRSCSHPAGVYLTDWTFIGDGNPDMLREKPHQINFNKRQKASELILMIKLHQSTTYNLAAVPQLKKFLETQLFTPSADPAMDDQRLYEISLTREPRERDDVRLAVLARSSDFSDSHFAGEDRASLVRVGIPVAGRTGRGSASFGRGAGRSGFRIHV